MNSIWDIFKNLQFITDTSRNGACSPEEASLALGNGQQQYLQECVRKGDREALIPFSKKENLTSSSNGVLAYPVDYAYFIALYKDAMSVEELNPSEVPERVRSVLYPMEQYPFFTRLETGLEIYPKQTTSITLQYLRNPTTPSIAYTVSGTSITYNPVGSVDLMFRKDRWFNVMLRALPYLGVNLSDKDVFALLNIDKPAQ